MSILAKINTAMISRDVGSNPIESRRLKLIASLEQQKMVWDAVKNNTKYTVKLKSTKPNHDKDSEQQKNKVKTIKQSFFEQDNCWYMYVRYGSRILNVYGRNNALMIDTFGEIPSVIDKVIEAVKEGELDKAIATVMIRRN